MKNGHQKMPNQISVLGRQKTPLVLRSAFCRRLFAASASAWVSGGPPNPYPLGWSRRAIGHLCFALASLSFGLGLFKGIQVFPRATNGAAAFIVLGALLALGPYIGRFVLIDNCLDRGGSWNGGTLQCSDE